MTRTALREPSRLERMGRAMGRLWRAARARPAQLKGSAAGPLIALETPGSPVWSPRDYAAFAREGMMQNAVVYRSVRMIAEAAASVPLLLYEGGREVEEHPLIDLLARPSPCHTAADLLEAWYGFLLVAGNAYLEAVALGGRLRELHVLRPDRMKVVPGADGWPEAWEYAAGGRTVRFAGEAVPGVGPILHLKLFHPANDHYGLSPIEAAAAAIDIHNAASRWNKALLDNSARPSGALVYTTGGSPTGEQFERIKGELEASFQGSRNAGRPLLLDACPGEGRGRARLEGDELEPTRHGLHRGQARRRPRDRPRAGRAADALGHPRRRGRPSGRASRRRASSLGTRSARRSVEDRSWGAGFKAFQHQLGQMA